MERKEEKYYTTRELIEYFKISRFAITRAINSGKLKATKRGRENIFSESAIKEYIRTNF